MLELTERIIGIRKNNTVVVFDNQKDMVENTKNMKEWSILSVGKEIVEEIRHLQNILNYKCPCEDEDEKKCGGKLVQAECEECGHTVELESLTLRGVEETRKDHEQIMARIAAEEAKKQAGLLLDNKTMQQTL
jgi:hypothetical protein